MRKEKRSQETDGKCCGCQAGHYPSGLHHNREAALRLEDCRCSHRIFFRQRHTVSEQSLHVMRSVLGVGEPSDRTMANK